MSDQDDARYLGGSWAFVSSAKEYIFVCHSFLGRTECGGRGGIDDPAARCVCQCIVRLHFAKTAQWNDVCLGR